MDPTEKQNLEHYVDKFGLRHVVDALSEICFDKSAHIAENWQDVALAKIWEKRGNVLNRVTARLNGEQSERLKKLIIQHHRGELDD